MQVEHYGARRLSPIAARSLLLDAGHYARYVLSVLRIVAALLFLEHGTSRLFGFPSPQPAPEFLNLIWFAGALELIGGVLLALGLFTRPVALIMSGEMAFAYFLSHAPNSFFPDPQPRRLGDPVLLRVLLPRLRRRRAVEPGCGRETDARLGPPYSMLRFDNGSLE